MSIIYLENAKKCKNKTIKSRTNKLKIISKWSRSSPITKIRYKKSGKSQI